MSYTISPVEVTEVTRLADIQWAALKANPLIQVMYPRGATTALTCYTTTSYQRAFTFPSAKLLKATNDATGEMVGFAKWILYRQEEEHSLREDAAAGLHKRSSAGLVSTQGRRRSSGWEKEKHLMPSMPPPDCHGMLLERWGAIINKTRKRVTGPRGHACRTGATCSLECYFSNFAENLWVLDIVHVLPLHQRQGVGSALINWGLEEADREGLHCYVEASPAARSILGRKGFQHLAEIRIELGRYREGFKDYRHSVMIRPPNGQVDMIPLPPTPPSKTSSSTISSFHDDPIPNPTHNHHQEQEQEQGQHDPVSPVTERGTTYFNEKDTTEDDTEDTADENENENEKEEEKPYTAEARMLEFRSTSSLRSARLTDARASAASSGSPRRPSTQRSSGIGKTLPQTPEMM